jgi:hypothetical protein
LHHCGLFATGDDPQDAARAIDYGVRQGHSPAALIRAAQRYVNVADVQDGIARHERRGVAVGSEAEVDHVDYGGCAGDVAESRGVLRRRRIEIRGFDRHRVNLFGRNRRLCEAFAEVREVAVGVAFGRAALIDLNDVDGAPRETHVRQRAQHHPRRMAAAYCHRESAAGGDGLSRLDSDQGRGSSSDRFGIVKNFDSHFVKNGPSLTMSANGSVLLDGDRQRCIDPGKQACADFIVIDLVEHLVPAARVEVVRNVG